MSDICNPCTKANLIPLCTTTVALGTISSLTTAVYVYQEHIGTGKITRYDVTSSGAGLVSFDPDNLMAGQEYEYWVTLASSVDMETKETLTIGGNTYDCVTLEYSMVSDSDDNSPETYASITVTI